MSYDDADISMASFRDDSIDMSVEHSSIDVVWHSTQPAAIQTMLEDAKRKSFLY